MRERAEHEPIELRGGAVHARLAEQDDVAAREIHVFVRRVIRRRPPFDRPVRRGVDVAHVDRQRRESSHVRRERARREQLCDRHALGRFPREPDADVDRLHVAAGGLLRQKDRAVEAAGEENGCGHW